MLSTRCLSIQQRCRLMNRSVRPVLFFRNTRWPCTRSLAEHQNRLQRHMLAYFVHVERMPWEDLAAHNRRRMRTIGNLARQQGAWGSQHAQRVVEWAEHLERPGNFCSLASRLYRWRGPEWLQNRRNQSGVNRPGTRILQGYLPKRWDESIADARRFS